MEKSLISKAVLALAVAGTMFVSCDKDDNKSSDNPTTDEIISQIPSVDGNKQLSVDEQKTYLDQVGKALMTEFQSANFDNVIDLINYAYEIYGENYNWDNVESWADDAYNSLVKTEKGATLVNEYSYDRKYWSYDEETHEEKSDIVTDRYLYYEDVTEVFYKASAYTGHFVAEKGQWTSSPADDLQFLFTDQNGKACVLTLTTSGKTVDAYFGEGEGDDIVLYPVSSFAEGQTFEYTDYINKHIVAVPENITLTLTQDGKEIIKSVVKTDLNIVSSTDYDLSKDTYAATTTTEINGYTFEVSKASISNKDKKAESYFKLTKGNVKLLEYSIKVDGEVSNDDDDYDINSLNTEITIDVLGKVQIKGISKDGGKLLDLIDEAKENDNNGTVYKEKIAAANALVDYGLYFDGGDTKQLTVVMEPFEEEYWNRTYWDYDYLIQFADGSKNTFEDYFVKANFWNVFNLWDEMSDDYENKIKVE